MSSPTSSSKTAAKATTTPIHHATSPPQHPPPHATGYPDEKSQDFTVHVHPAESTDDHKSTTPSTPLQVFHSALGIPPPKPPKQVKPTKKNPNPPPPEDKPNLTAKNKGIYKQVLSCERSARWKYYFCEFSVTTAMFLQIIVGASLTAFGAGKSSHILITCFGAGNTALASLLAVLKSQGLPNRIRQDWIGWRDLREYIEKTEREIEMALSGRIPGAKGVTESEIWDMVKTIEEKYRAVRLTCEANRPDGYTKVDPHLPK